MIRWIGVALGVTVIAAVAWWNLSRPEQTTFRFGVERAGASDLPFSYQDYAAVLRAYVDDQGMVDYEGLKAHRERLDAFAGSIGRLDPRVYDQWTEDEKIAFWINAYNSLTLEVIVTHYPIEPSFAAALLFPKNSILQIRGAWDELRFDVMGRSMTLDDIEHKTLRAQFNEPRIHMALVCAAKSCPTLRNEPYLGDVLEHQLQDQTRRFLRNPLKFKIEPTEDRILLSPIFKWFGEDFVRTYGGETTFTSRDETERAVLSFISQFLDENDRAYLVEGRYDIEYLDYDWSLNEQGNK